MKQVPLLLFLFHSIIGFTQLITPFTIRYKVTKKGEIRFLANKAPNSRVSNTYLNTQADVPAKGPYSNLITTICYV
jgi:hypothetical protein